MRPHTDGHSSMPFMGGVKGMVMMILMLLLAGGGHSLAQVSTDPPADGFYFIQNNNNNQQWYLCVSGNKFNGDAATPFVRTKQNPTLDEIWELRKDGDPKDGVQYYNIIHHADGKYLVANSTTLGAYQGCKPINIGELYGCGNKAAYSVYGYESGGTVKTSGESPVADPTVNIISCTSIGKVFGGGFGTKAQVVGNPVVNINQIKGRWAGQTIGTGDDAVTIPDDIGTIGTVFGGGNAAPVVGSPHVKVATESTVTLSSGDDHTAQKVIGANITGNVYGGGNNAIVTGNTKVEIGKEGGE